ncbi:hypothetical protein F5Y02DRAFT_400240 [Annulohypoxylon stygium]|nr:hypothetical protein F5Y02DRAFT_400240 [Annulohypoxylon stygium]
MPLYVRVFPVYETLILLISFKLNPLLILIQIFLQHFPVCLSSPSRHDLPKKVGKSLMCLLPIQTKGHIHSSHNPLTFSLGPESIVLSICINSRAVNANQ